MAGKFGVLLSVLALIVQVQGYKLKQVLLLSRHNIRAPLVENLSSSTNNEFPKWKQKPGYLTEKGAKQEEYMGEYFQKWLAQHNMVLDECRAPQDIHIHANTKQRTRESALAFAQAAFKKCNVTIHTIDSEEMDPVFNPVVRNPSEELKQAIVNEMQAKLDGLHLQDAYNELSEIIDYKNSNSCKINNLCDFVYDQNFILYEIGVEPNILGPLNVANALVDSFLMSYYDGMPLEQVAWGKITTLEQWEKLTQITRENQNVRFNGTLLAKEVARPLLKYMLEIFEHKSPPKFTLLVGHDSNLNPVMSAIGFVHIDLPQQYEKTPIGGKLVFQKYEDDAGRDVLRVDFVYQSFARIRSGLRLSMEQPPYWVPMEINNCIDENGYCPWDSFIDILRKI